ncbi:hypothetical protein DZB84_23200 [Bacillus sp. HNG]|uniref:hypothetical protein n=1 Tax=Bacillus sp. HNG TaxID=2293325 RepID=UPI000E2E9CAD|nr:hypothetical protein [Bacillus sp. HNG]RFB10193.1 hypothetical protein DZB84_23200 [Bacillus sp. HNG]
MKQSKKETVYDDSLKSLQNITLTAQEKSEIHLKMIESVEKSDRRNKIWGIRPIFNAILTGILLFIGGYFLVNQVIFSEEGNLGHENAEVQSPYTEIENKVSDVLQAPVYIPYHENLPLRTAMFIMETTSTEEGEVIGRKHGAAIIGYSTLEADQADAAEFERLKEQGRLKLAPYEIVYGDFLKAEKYKATIAIMSEKTSRKDLIYSALYGEERIIAGHTVKYRVVDTGSPLNDKAYYFSFKLNNAVYVYTFPEKNVTEEAAYSFVEKSLKQILKR